MPSEMERRVLSIVYARADLLGVVDRVAALHLPQCWIGAGFLRAPVWDALHGYVRPTSVAGIDVIYFDLADPSRRAERDLEARLSEAGPGLPWSMRNQARMHLGNDDPPYAGTADAVAKWVETPTTAAIRRAAGGGLELLAPHGLSDLLHLIVRPTPHFRHRPEVYWRRVTAKNWTATWPLLRVLAA